MIERKTIQIGWSDEAHTQRSYAPANYGTVDEVREYDIINTLGIYEDLREEERLIILPVPYGTPIYHNTFKQDGTPITVKKPFEIWMVGFWNKTCFKTFEEACKNRE